ncbi:MAG: FcoT family thioesterase [Gammaproteobacteria bacterium]|nr:FcoT family thioesterase [Gammaproteobacteria bacterium]
MTLPLIRETEVSVDPQLLDSVLSPYHRTETDYLKSACVGTFQPSKVPTIAALTGSYSIPSSCYIDATGHFNAVELIICYNQLAYALFGHLVSTNALIDLPVGNRTEEADAALRGMTFEKFRKHQLALMFILKTNLAFRGFIEPSQFGGTVGIEKIFYRRKTFFITTHCNFFDDAGGNAGGEILLAYPTHLAD